MTENTSTVNHLPDENKFIISLAEGPAFLEYEMDTAGTMMVMHTEVPEAKSGKGHAAELARAAMIYAQENGLKVMPYCTFMAVFLKRNKETYKSAISPEFKI